MRYIARAKVRNAERRDKRRAYKKTVKGKEAENRYRRKNFSGDVVQNRRLVKLYNITLEEYKMMLDKQGCACAICGEIPENKLHIDHCHKTDKVRGLLCGSCNRALGLFKDNLDTIEASLIYLKNDL